MSDSFWIALFTGIPGIIAALAAAVLAVMQYRNNAKINKVVEQQVVNTIKMDAVAENVLKVEVATNSMKDQLVAVVEKEALSRGRDEQREKGDVKLAELKAEIKADRNEVKAEIKEEAADVKVVNLPPVQKVEIVEPPDAKKKRGGP